MIGLEVVRSFDALKDQIILQPELQGIAVDASLIIRNQTGQRPCERLIGKTYGSRKASCHTSNLKLYPDPASVRLSLWLETVGFQHLGPAPKKWQIECYPHPALVEIFDLPQRHLYKKGSVAQKRQGQIELAGYLASLRRSPVLPLEIPLSWRACLSEEHISGLRGAGVKQNEDCLDALVCLYIAGLYTLKPHQKIFGDAQTGYIYVPAGKCC